MSFRVFKKSVDLGVPFQDNVPVTAFSGDITGLELRLLPPYIKDNRTEKIWPFPGYAKLYCLTILVSDVENKLVGSIDLKGFPRIGDNENLPINKTLFYWLANENAKTAPSQIHLMVSVIKSKQGLRDTAAVLSQLGKNDEYKSLTKQLASMAANTTVAGAVLDIVTALAGVVGKILEGVDDKPLGTFVQSLTELHRDFDHFGSQKIPIATKYVDFELDCIVRRPMQPLKFAGFTENPFLDILLPEPDKDVVVDMKPL